jgi:transcriptional regulator PpsR
MDIPVIRESSRSFSNADVLFEALSPTAVGELLSASANVAVLVSETGIVQDVAYRSPDLAMMGADKWVGRKFADTVSADSAQKIADMLREVAERGLSRRRQVNHNAASMEDLPVDYVLVRAPGMPGSIALGTELRRQLELQQQLINTQIDLERRNREITEKAARYRAQFKLSEVPTIVVGGADMKIVEANAAAAGLLGVTERKLEGTVLASLIDPAFRAVIAEKMTATRFSGDQATLGVTLAAGQNVHMNIRPFREASAVNLVVTFDAGLKQAGGGSERKAETLALSLLPDACVIVDEDGTVNDVNNHFVDMAGLAGKSQVIDRNISDWLGASPVDMNVLISRLRQLGTVRRFSSILNDSQGASRPVVLSASSFESAGKSRIVIAITENNRGDSHFRLQPSGDISTSTDFAALIGRVPLKELIRDAADIIEKMCIEAALRQTANNRASAADLLGLSRQSLYMKLRRYGLEDFNV